MDSEIQTRNQTTVTSVDKAFISRPKKTGQVQCNLKSTPTVSSDIPRVMYLLYNVTAVTPYWIFIIKRERQRKNIWQETSTIPRNCEKFREIIYLDMWPAENQKLSFWCSACIWDVSHCRRIISREQMASDAMLSANCSLALGSSVSHIQGWCCNYSDDCQHTVLLLLSNTSSNVAITSLPMCQCWHMWHTQGRQQQSTCHPLFLHRFDG